MRASVSQKTEREAESNESSTHISAWTARMIATDYVMDHFGDRIGVEEPVLRRGKRSVWEVPLWLHMPGAIGQVGAVKVDAVSGELMVRPGDRPRVMAEAERVYEASFGPIDWSVYPYCHLRRPIKFGDHPSDDVFAE